MLARSLVVAAAVTAGLAVLPVGLEWWIGGRPPFVKWMGGYVLSVLALTLTCVTWIGITVLGVLWQRWPQLFRIPTVAATVFASAWSIVYFSPVAKEDVLPASNFGAFVVLAVFWPIAFAVSFISQATWTVVKRFTEQKPPGTTGGSAG